MSDHTFVALLINELIREGIAWIEPGLQHAGGLHEVIRILPSLGWRTPGVLRAVELKHGVEGSALPLCPLASSLRNEIQ